MKNLEEKKYKPILSIVVPVLNEATKTVRCFKSIRANTKTPYELIWVDNGSQSDQYRIIRYQATRPKIHCKLIRNKNNKGFIKATNQGIREAVGKYIVLLNNDTEVTWEWDKELLRPFKADSKVGAVGPITNSLIGWPGWANVERRWNLGLPPYRDDHNSYAGLLKGKFSYKYKEVGGRKLPLPFFCTCIPKKIFDKIGLLDEAFGIGIGDDDDYAMRMSVYGYKQMLALGCFVLHHHRTSFNSLKLEVDSIRRNSLKVLRRKAKEYKLLERELKKRKKNEKI
jgi:GT2 family glycosyltransferase